MTDATDISEGTTTTATDAGSSTRASSSGQTSSTGAVSYSTENATGSTKTHYSYSPAAGHTKQAKKEAKPFHSGGYHIHNEVTYRVVDWLANSTVGVSTTYWAHRTEHGKRNFSGPVASRFKKVFSGVIKNEAALAEGSKWFASFLSIMAGGFAIIPVMMVLENKNNKKHLIRWMDQKIYGAEKVANDPRFEASYRKIDEEPTKGFWAGMLARIIAIVPLIVVSSIPATNKVLMKYIYDPIGNSTKWAAGKLHIRPYEILSREGEKIHIKPGKMLIQGAMEHLDGNPNTPKTFQNNWDFLHRTIGFDFGLTIFYALMHEASYKSLAAAFEDKPKKHAKSEPQQHDSVPDGSAKATAPDETKSNALAGDASANLAKQAMNGVEQHKGVDPKLASELAQEAMGGIEQHKSFTREDLKKSTSVQKPAGSFADRAAAASETAIQV